MEIPKIQPKIPDLSENADIPKQDTGAPAGFVQNDSLEITRDPVSFFQEDLPGAAEPYKKTTGDGRFERLEIRENLEISESVRLLSASSAASSMKAAGADAASVVGMLRERGLSPEEIAKELKDVGYSAEEAARAMYTMFDLGFSVNWQNDLAALLKAGGYDATEIAKGLMAKGLSSQDVRDALGQLGYDQREIERAMMGASLP